MKDGFQDLTLYRQGLGLGEIGRLLQEAAGAARADAMGAFLKVFWTILD
jgi:hypothetical protein